MKPAILVIDVQKEYSKGGALEIPNINKTLPKIAQLIMFARHNNIELIHIQHINKDENAEDFNKNSKNIEFIDNWGPKGYEKVITKHYPGAFFKTDLKEYLDSKGIDSVIICGYSSFLCCDTTAREAYQHDYNVYYIEDAIGEFEIGNYTTEEIHQFTCTVQAESGFSTILSTSHIIDILQ